MEKLHPKSIGLASAAVSAIGYVLCVLFFAVAPEGALQFFSAMFHGVDITEIAADMVWSSAIILGFVEIVVLSFVGGWLFAVLYNVFAKKHVG